MFMKSSSGMFHKVGRNLSGIGQLSKCASFNLDKPNVLTGVAIETLPTNAKVCKKCSAHA